MTDPDASIYDSPPAGSPADGGFGVLHVLDDQCTQEAAFTVRILLDRLGPAQYPQQVVAVGDGPHRHWLNRYGIDHDLVPARGDAEPLRLLALGKRLARGLTAPGGQRLRLIHAHSPHAGMLVGWATIPRPALAAIPLAVELTAEGCNRELGSLAHLSGKQGRVVNVLARSQELRRQAVGAGLGLEHVGVLRPPIELSRVTASDRGEIRRRLGIEPDAGPVLLASGWCGRKDGQRLALWAAAILSMLDDSLRIVVPGVGPELHAWRHWIANAGFAHLARFPEEQFDWPQLIAAADLLVHASSHEIETTPVAWAMSAGVPIVATAVTGTAELLEDNHNALLAQPDQPRHLAMQIRRMLTDEPLRRKLADQARHEAFHYFKPSDIVALYKKFYQHYRLEELGLTIAQ